MANSLTRCPYECCSLDNSCCGCCKARVGSKPTCTISQNVLRTSFHGSRSLSLIFRMNHEEEIAQFRADQEHNEK